MARVVAAATTLPRRAVLRDVLVAGVAVDECDDVCVMVLPPEALLVMCVVARVTPRGGPFGSIEGRMCCAKWSNAKTPT
jgi:hypothetical protein